MSDEQAPSASPLDLDFGGFLAALRAFQRDFLVEGVDFGTVPGTSGKPTLLKPGAEKVCTWLHLRPAFEADHGTWVQAGSVPGLFAYVCRLVDATGQIAGEGRGSAHVDEGIAKFSRAKQQSGEARPWPANVAIKFAEKRALVDAVLRVGCLSAAFTQDLEDLDQQADAAFKAQQARQQAQARPTPAAVSQERAPYEAPAPNTHVAADADPNGFDEIAPAASTPEQIKAIRALLTPAGLTEAELRTRLGMDRLEDLPNVRAQKTIDWLQARTRKKDRAAA